MNLLLLATFILLCDNYITEIKSLIRRNISKTTSTFRIILHTSF